MKKKRLFRTIVHGIFLITVGFVLLIAIYLIVSRIPTIHEIGIFQFL